VQIGRIDDARNLFAEAIPLYQEKLFARPWTFPEAAFDLGETAAARGIVERLPPSLRRRAMLAALDGNFEEATRAYGEAGVRLLEAESRLRWAEQLVAAGRRDQGLIQLEEALSFYRSVGATLLIQRGEQLLAKTA
jgi:tetratricopeptide (TPR) repeat protein